jgi:hypothetical protein
MNNEFKLTITDFFQFSNGETCLIGDVEPINQNFITSDYIAKIIVNDIEERPLNIMGQEIFSNISNPVKVKKTVIRTKDNLSDIIPYLGKKKIIVTGYLPE